MSAIPQQIIYDPGIRLVEQIKTPRPPYTKRLIRRACVQVLMDEQAHPREKMKAAGILERMDRERVLARRRRIKKSAQISAKSNPISTLDAILARTGTG